MDLINRNELNKKILKLMDNYVSAGKNDKISVCRDILYFIAEMPDENEQEKEKPVSAKWIVWGGWKGNHDQRIEDATCSNCGFKHSTVKGSLDNLSGICPRCKAKMVGFVET